MKTILHCDTCSTPFELDEAVRGKALEYAPQRFLCSACAAIAHEENIISGNQQIHAEILRRCFAFLIDVLPITLLTAFLFYQLTAFGEFWSHYLKEKGFKDPELRGEYNNWKILIRTSAGVIYIFYAAWMESQTGTTIGKRIMGIKVVDAEYQPLSFGRSFQRNTYKIMSAIPAMAGYLVALFGKKKRTWHDRAAGAYIVRT